MGIYRGILKEFSFPTRCFSDCSFSSAWKKTNQKKTPVSHLALRIAKPGDDAAPCAAMRRCQANSGAHNLAIAACLTTLGALPDSTMLAASSGLCGRRTRKLARRSTGSNSPRAFFRPHRRCSARDKRDSKNSLELYNAYPLGLPEALRTASENIILLPVVLQFSYCYEEEK